MLSLPQRFVVHLLIVLSLVSAGISPACKFIAGRYDVMEICGALGAKTVRVPADSIPAGQHQKHDDHRSDGCAFCFSAGHSKAAEFVAAIFPAPLQNIIRFSLFAVFEQQPLQITSGFLARGPPSSAHPSQDI